MGDTMELTLQDLKNLRALLNRVTATGVDEARVVAVVAGKLDALIAAPPATEAPTNDG